MPTKIEISRRTIVFTFFFFLLLWFFFFIKDLILELFVALLIMTVLNPLVNSLTKIKIPRPIAVLISYLGVIGVIGVLIVNLSPPLIDQTTSFVNNLPVYIETLGIAPQFGDNAVQEFLGQIGILPAHFAEIALSVFSNIIEVITVLVFAFYLLVSRNNLDEQFSYFFGKDSKEKIDNIIDKLEFRLGGWVRGQLLLMLIVGIATYIGLRLLSFPFALPLSILAGLLEVVPFVGPIIAAVPAVIIGFGISPVIGFATVALAFLIQQLEGYVFVPAIMQRSVGISSFVVLLSLAVGFRLFGFVGAIISIPAVLTIEVLMKELDLTPKRLL